MTDFTRREFLKMGTGTCFALMVPHFIGCDNRSNSSVITGGQTTVYVTLGDELSELYVMAKQASEKLGLEKNSLLGSTVYIKPNLVALGLSVFVPGHGECTKAEIIAGVAEKCLEAGAAKVTIGEGAQGVDWEWDSVAFFPGNKINGASDLVTAIDYLKTQFGENKIELENVHKRDEWEYIPSSSNHQIMSNGLMIAKGYYDADHVISLPVAKTHMYGTITASMKNCCGIIPITHLGIGDVFRGYMHCCYSETSIGGIEDATIEGAFMDVCRWRQEEGRQDFAIVDCSIGLEGTGPHHISNTLGMGMGTTIDIKSRNAIGKYFLLACNDLPAVDTVTAWVMNIDPEEVKQLQMANNIGIGDNYDIKLDGASIEDLYVPDWEPPNMFNMKNDLCGSLPDL